MNLQAMERFYAEVSTPIQVGFIANLQAPLTFDFSQQVFAHPCPWTFLFEKGVCQNLKRLGGEWWPQWKAVDGDKFVCFDSYKPSSCLIYSFGIRLDSFQNHEMQSFHFQQRLELWRFHGEVELHGDCSSSSTISSVFWTFCWEQPWKRMNINFFPALTIIMLMEDIVRHLSFISDHKLL